jgi:hypothetical protein
VLRVTLQDVMRLDNEGRMNRPGRAEGNWAWRVGPPSVWKSLAKEAAALKDMAEVCQNFLVASGGQSCSLALTADLQQMPWPLHPVCIGMAACANIIVGKFVPAATQVYDRLPPREMEVAAEGPHKP